MLLSDAIAQNFVNRGDQVSLVNSYMDTIKGTIDYIGTNRVVMNGAIYTRFGKEPECENLEVTTRLWQVTDQDFEVNYSAE